MTGEGGRTPLASPTPPYPPRGCLRVCHVNYGDPTVPFTDCSSLKEIPKSFLLASTVTDGTSSPIFIFWHLINVAVWSFVSLQALGLQSPRNESGAFSTFHSSSWAWLTCVIKVHIYPYSSIFKGMNKQTSKTGR